MKRIIFIFSLLSICVSSLFLSGCAKPQDDTAMSNTDSNQGEMGAGFGSILWKLVNGVIQPSNSTWNLNIPGSITASSAYFGKLNVTTTQTISAFANSTGSIPFVSDGTGKLGVTNTLFWDNVNGRLGIGTSAPTQKVEISGVTPMLKFTDTKYGVVSLSMGALELGVAAYHGLWTNANPSVSNYIFRGDDINAYFNSNGAGNINFRHDNVSQMSLTAGGYLGIGTTTPTALLSLGQGTTPALGINFGGDTNLYRSDVNTLRTDDTLYVAGGMNLNLGGSGLSLNNNSGLAYGYFFANADNGLALGLDNSDGYSNNNFIISSVLGRAQNFLHNTPSANPTLILHSMSLAASSTVEWGSMSFNTTTFKGLYNQVGSGGFLWGSSTTNWAVIDSLGRMGIGTTTPQFGLQVAEGTVTSTMAVGVNGIKAGCIPIQDTDKAGWTYCTALNGVLTCSTNSCL